MEKARPVNFDLVGQNDGVFDLETPALVLHKQSFEANLEFMAKHCLSQNCALRPHAKTHKSVKVAKRQIERGAVGVCCAKLGEAESLAAGGINDILLTSPIVSDRSFERLFQLIEQGVHVQLVVDDIEVTNRLARLASKRGIAVDVLVDVDPGMHRTGICFTQVQELVQTIENLPMLSFSGLQVYAGNHMHIASYDERKNRTNELAARVHELKDSLESQGFQIPRISGGGTGSFDIDPATGVFSELQAGSYPFMDVQYQAIEYAHSKPAPFRTSLFVATRVISSNTNGMATTDAGFKAFATDDCNPILRDYSPEEAEYRFMGDEHGAVLCKSADVSFTTGDLIFAITPHCDPTINLYDYMHVIDGNALIDIWDIDARGRSA